MQTGPLYHRLRLATWPIAAMICLVWSALCAATDQEQSVRYGKYQFVVQRPAGLQFEILTGALRAPRLLSFAPNGDLLIGSRVGEIHRFAPPYTRGRVLLNWPDPPQSVLIHRGRLVFAGTEGVYAAPYDPDLPRIDPASVSRLVALPGGRGHNSRTIGVGPDGELYLSIGISGNCSDEFLSNDKDLQHRRGGIARIVTTGTTHALAPFATGLRNPVGFDWHPSSGVLYASNHGPDHHGFDQPPEYFAKLTPHSFHGMPWFQYDGKQIQRDGCITSPPPRPATEVSLPAATFPARNAPMGVTFLRSGALQREDLVGDALVALHGSWATAPDGLGSGDPASRRHAKIVRVEFKDGQAIGVSDFVTGFQLDDGTRWLRPVGLAVGPDNALYFTSDGGINGLFRLRPSHE